ncbi:hypothetical protein Dsin_016389 [Dipteronia sinensis]|uniref:DUF4371 domain-containing protein n=1 Tax=Dipteronia sinensis TaxID=43782 RepID=A0AAE0ADT0_9ROSI|nr:hypothetical protein Dsin_016389 [Dipteronia sinensis]
MRGEWNGLQALFLKDCPYAYYVHCFAHRLQLALVAASKEKFYPKDFVEDELNALKRQLEHYKFDVLRQPQFQNSTLVFNPGYVPATRLFMRPNL